MRGFFSNDEDSDLSHQVRSGQEQSSGLPQLTAGFGKSLQMVLP